MRQQSWPILARQGVDDAGDVAAIDGAQHRARIGFGQRAAAERDQLIQQAQGIAHAAVGGPRQQRQRRGLECQCSAPR